jgi:hypothetical protein
MKYGTVIWEGCGGGNECVLVQNNSQSFAKTQLSYWLCCVTKNGNKFIRLSVGKVCDICMHVHENMINVNMTESEAIRNL